VDAWITLPAQLASVEVARQWLLRQLEGADVAPAALFRIDLVLEELLMNVVRHGHPGPSAADGFTLRLGAARQGDELLLCLEDDGVPFDPVGVRAPEPAATLSEARVGGLGLVLVHKSARSLRHERVGSLNRLWVTLPLQARAG
jgi:serine/threonine-protein kinase RsbW